MRSLTGCRSHQKCVETQNHQASSCQFRVTHDPKTDINELKSIEYCPPSNRAQAEIAAQSPSRAAQNHGVLLTACGTPPHDTTRKSHGRNNFDDHRSQTLRAKPRNHRAPHHLAPTPHNHPRKTRPADFPTNCAKSRGRVLRSWSPPIEQLRNNAPHPISINARILHHPFDNNHLFHRAIGERDVPK